MAHSSEFIRMMRDKFNKAQAVWNEKVGRLHDMIIGGPKTDEYQSVFECILRLFLGHGAAAVRELEELYEVHPEEIEFYIPQLVIFLLYGSFETAGALHASVLHMCRNSSIFAHHVYWFVVAFSLSGAGVTEEGVVTLKRLLNEIESCGEEQAKLLSIGQGHGEKLTDNADTAIDASLHSDDALETKSPSTTGFLSLDISDSSRYPITLARMPPGCKSSFLPTLLFWDKMIQVSRALCITPRQNRTDELRSQISLFLDDFFPSSTIYAPLGNEYHRCDND